MYLVLTDEDEYAKEPIKFDEEQFAQLIKVLAISVSDLKPKVDKSSSRTPKKKTRATKTTNDPNEKGPEGRLEPRP